MPDILDSSPPDDDYVFKEITPVQLRDTQFPEKVAENEPVLPAPIPVTESPLEHKYFDAPKPRIFLPSFLPGTMNSDKITTSIGAILGVLTAAAAWGLHVPDALMSQTLWGVIGTLAGGLITVFGYHTNKPADSTATPTASN